MPCETYIDKNFTEATQQIIIQANVIIDEYQSQGFRLTLRQLYYQFVARDLIRNDMKSYKRLGGIINDARLAGLIDWEAIEDRTRNLAGNTHWENPSEILAAAAGTYLIDKWEIQDIRPEVWIEKEALVGVIERICRQLDVKYFACRGYVSQSEMWGAAQRLDEYCRKGQSVVILHLGDHDPSGIDMTRDIEDRLNLFMPYGDITIKRLALNMNQVEKYNPPPNPAKQTDSRFTGYTLKFGSDSWELDALDPKVITALIKKEILALRDERNWVRMMVKEKEGRELLQKLAQDNQE